MECKQLLFDDSRYRLTGKTEWLEPNISHSYFDIYQYQLFTENHNDVGSSMGFGIGRAIIGGALLGPVGGALLGLTKRNLNVYSYTACTIAISFKQGESISVTVPFDVAMDYMKALDHAYQLANSDDDDDDDDDEIECNAIPLITEKSTATEEPEPLKMRKPITVNSGADADALIKRAFSFLEDGDWERADVYSDNALDLELERSDAYLVKLMVERKVNFKNELSEQDTPLEESPYYQKALKYADAEFTAWLQDCNKEIKCRPIYTEACKLLSTATDIQKVEQAQQLFQSIRDYKDVSDKLKQCQKKIGIIKEKEKEIELEFTYTKADILLTEAVTVSEVEKAQQLFQSISSYKDVYNKIQLCKKQIDKINENNYISAIKILENAQTEEECSTAELTFKELADYKDSSSYLQKCADKLEEVRKIERERLQKARIQKRKKALLLTGILCISIIIIGICIKNRIQYMNSKEYLILKAQDYISDAGGYEKALESCGQMDDDVLKQEVYVQITNEAMTKQYFEIALEAINSQIVDEAKRQELLAQLAKEAMTKQRFEVALKVINSQIVDEAKRQELLAQLAKEAITGQNFEVALKVVNSQIADETKRQELLVQLAKEAMTKQRFETALEAVNSQIVDEAKRQELLAQLAKEAIMRHNFEVALKICRKITDIPTKQKFFIHLAKEASVLDSTDVKFYHIKYEVIKSLRQTGMKIADISLKTDIPRKEVKRIIHIQLQ